MNGLLILQIHLSLKSGRQIFPITCRTCPNTKMFAYVSGALFPHLSRAENERGVREQKDSQLREDKEETTEETQHRQRKRKE